MNTVGEVLLKRKRPMTISQIADAAGCSDSHAKNSVTSRREKSRWVPKGMKVVRETDEKGTNRYYVI